MTKNNGWKLIWLILGLVPLVLIACGGSAATVPVLEEAVEMEEMEGETAVSDEVLSVAAKPQLIEFYADW